MASARLSKTALSRRAKAPRMAAAASYPPSMKGKRATGSSVQSLLSRLLARFRRQPVYRTKSGRILTDADIQALADEAERGYDVDHLLQSRPG